MGRGIQFNNGLGLADPTGHVRGPQAQAIGIGTEVTRIERHERCASHGVLAGGDRHEIVAAELRNLELPGGQIGVLHGRDDRKRGSDAATTQGGIEPNNRGRRVGRIPDGQSLLDGACEAVEVRGGRDETNQTGCRRLEHCRAAVIERDWRAVDD